MTKKNEKHGEVKAVKAVEKNELIEFETALLTALSLGVIRKDFIDAAIVKAGFAISEAEHAENKPIDKKEQASVALQAFGIDVESLTSKPATSKALTDSLKGLWLEIEPDKTLDKQGTAFCNYYMTQCIKAGEAVKKAALLAYVQKEYRAHYANVGHYATWLKRLSDENVPHVKGNGYFKVTA